MRARTRTLSAYIRAICIINLRLRMRTRVCPYVRMLCHRKYVSFGILLTNILSPSYSYSSYKPML